MKGIKVRYYCEEDREAAKKMEAVLNWYAKQPEFKLTPAQKIYENLITQDYKDLNFDNLN